MADALHLTFMRDCPHGLAADPVTGRAAETKWISYSVARALIAEGFALEVVVDLLLAAVFAKADANGQVGFRMLSSGLVFTMPKEIALDCVRRGDAELV
jgi:hypothetical protein